MRYSAALTTEVHEVARSHLLRSDGQEDVCFALWYPSEGISRTTALIHQLVLPESGDRKVHGNASFFPAYIDRVIGLALEKEAGIAFMHSHPLGRGWQGMSQDDKRTENRLAGPVFGATGLPLVGLTLASDQSWCARAWEKGSDDKYRCKSCETVRVAGDALRVSFNDSLIPPPEIGEELMRTVSVWGPKIQQTFARLRVGVVGTGSVGSIVAESLARMGVSNLELLDFDYIERKNLDRLLHATAKDIGKPKVEVLARGLRTSATAQTFQVNPHHLSITEEEGYRIALDCDILFSCVDNKPWARSVLNHIAYAHLIPIIDGGISAETMPGNAGVKRADWRAHVAIPGRRCLACLNQYDPGLVQADREGMFENSSYISGFAADHPLLRRENIFVFSTAAASMEMLQFIAMVVAPCGLANMGAQHYHFVGSILDIEDKWECNPNCYFTTIVAKGDRSGITVTGEADAPNAKKSKGGIGAWIKNLLSGR
ncbi:ThiF family adenylyltransferase [Patescibacteria group bacterium]|nr:ThiF family adenylyltransferase [Patescibacteria group bacterium]